MSKQNRSCIELILECLSLFNDIVSKSIDCVKLISRANLSSFWLTPMSEYNTSILWSLLKMVSNISSHRSRIFIVEWFMFNYKWQVLWKQSFIYKSSSILYRTWGRQQRQCWMFRRRILWPSSLVQLAHSWIMMFRQA